MMLEQTYYVITKHKLGIPKEFSKSISSLLWHKIQNWI
jgi:hypothetical protein